MQVSCKKIWSIILLISTLMIGKQADIDTTPALASTTLQLGTPNGFDLLILELLWCRGWAHITHVWAMCLAVQQQH